MNRITIKSKDKKMPFKNYLKSEEICVLLDSREDYIVYVKKNDYVYKGSLLAKSKGKFTKNLFSSVSGFVEDIKVVNKDKYIVIKNDFKEKIEKRISEVKDITKYTKEEWLELLKDTGIVGMGGAGFPTYAKYENEGLKTLIVNAVECEPFLSSDATIIKEKIEEILSCIDAIIEINHLEKAYIVLKKKHVDLKKKIESYLGTYDKIFIVDAPDFYPMGWERNVVKLVTKKDYKVLPSEVGVVVNNISTIYAIYQTMKYKKPILERIITIGGDMVKNPCHMLVKVGTKVEEILSQVSLKRNEDVVIYFGGPMMGKSVNLEEPILITTNAIMFDSKKEINEQTCLRCSKCVEYCPASLEPVLIKDALKNKEELILLHPEKCIECGLCSYICPSKIKLRDKVIEAKEIIRRK